ncbi:M23 family metallopeptidase [Microbacterium allomyrinae]|uniref:M23 family metallopeptidase n=1 Tax=Microbacterium allomyrinae TaxID=2830666 RepID=A0A9X1LVH6_9MICO|nr:M23 family metallopeptidase [Microbacterium allomyrinae]MCC2032597.1 M23 family metallopeptidase [Microbacterium allomyrinae]
MILRRRETSRWRALLVTGAIVLSAGIVSAGIPTGAIAQAGAGDPSTPAPTEPATIDPTPAPSDSETPTPAPTPTSTAPPSPSVPVPSEPSPSPVPWVPAPLRPAPTPSGEPTIAAPSPESPALATAPAAFGRVYPTNPWIYNAAPGTRYLDARGLDGQLGRRLHLGIDAQGGVRQPIFAVAAGTVTGGTWGTTRSDGHGFGNQVRITHADGYASRYAHLSEAPLVRQGEYVEAGQLIGYMGGSQRGDLHALARHLHFEVTRDGRNIDPVAFLDGADAAAALSATPAIPAPTTTAPETLLYEIRPGRNDSYVSISTGIAVDSSVFTAVAMGGDSAEIMVSEEGMLRRISVVDGSWTKVDTGLALNATSISGVDAGTGFPELLAVEDGRLLHIEHGPAGWTKTWTGHYFTGTVSAVRLPGGELHAMLQQAGYLYHLSPAAGGSWNIADTRLEVGEQVDAAYVDGPAPEAMAVIDGEVQRITWDGIAWVKAPTGLPASGSIAAVYQGGGWPVAVSAESGVIGVTRVVQRVWQRHTYGVAVTGPIDAVALGSQGPLLYSIG